MREVPLGRNAAAADFARRLLRGEIDVVLFMTGVGFRYLLEEVTHAPGADNADSAGSGLAAPVDRAAYLAALARVVTIARGPKPVAAMKEHGLQPTYRVGEPNTWREVLQTIDAHVPLAGRTIAVQEYGIANPNLMAGLAARGARVLPVTVYRYDFPQDAAPLEANVRAVAGHQREVVLFTSAHQVVNVLRMAARIGQEDALRAAMHRLVVASIGPTTSEALHGEGLPVDLEPEHPRMGSLVAAAAEQAAELLAAKRRASGSPPAAAGSPPASRSRAAAAGTPRVLPPATGSAAPALPGAAGATLSAARHPSWDSPLMRACRREPAPYTPIWLMRQAGRYLPEYREVRSRTTFLELCKNPQLCAEVMIRTVERLKVDAAIIFSDLLPILEPMGLELEFAQGEGPVIHNPVREPADVDRVRELDSVAELDFVMQTVRATRAGLDQRIPVIGFAGAPFTLASYVIEGGASRNYLFTKTLMYRDAGAWAALLSRLARAVTRYLNAQIEAGAQCVQLFDSWVGCLHPDDYRRYVLPYTRQVIAGLPPGTPVINFATGNPALLPCLAQAGGAVIGVDWRIRLDDAWGAVGPQHGVQGNLDPAVLLAEVDEIRRRTKEILDQAAGRPGHIFNLGHGVLPQTPPGNVEALVAMVHDLSAERRAAAAGKAAS
jgi:uroporphyrinogen decarboxylase